MGAKQRANDAVADVYPLHRLRRPGRQFLALPVGSGAPEQLVGEVVLVRLDAALDHAGEQQPASMHQIPGGAYPFGQ